MKLGDLEVTDLEVGSLVELTHTVTVDGIPTDPSTIRALVKPPGSPEIEAEYAGGAGQVSRSGPGSYFYRFTITEAGAWAWRWETTGAAQEAQEGSFWVQRSAFV